MYSNVSPLTNSVNANAPHMRAIANTASLSPAILPRGHGAVGGLLSPVCGPLDSAGAPRSAPEVPAHHTNTPRLSIPNASTAMPPCAVANITNASSLPIPAALTLLWTQFWVFLRTQSRKVCPRHLKPRGLMRLLSLTHSHPFYSSVLHTHLSYVSTTTRNPNLTRYPTVTAAKIITRTTSNVLNQQHPANSPQNFRNTIHTTTAHHVTMR